MKKSVKALLALLTLLLCTTLFAACFESNDNDIAVQSVAVNGSSTATVGTDQTYSATITPSNATLKTVTWTVTNGTGSANISNTGLLTPLSEGTVTVTATAHNNISDSLVVTVSPAQPSATQLSKPTVSFDDVTDIITVSNVDPNAAGVNVTVRLWGSIHSDITVLEPYARYQINGINTQIYAGQTIDLIITAVTPDPLFTASEPADFTQITNHIYLPDTVEDPLIHWLWPEKIFYVDKMDQRKADYTVIYNGEEVSLSENPYNPAAGNAFFTPPYRPSENGNLLEVTVHPKTAAILNSNQPYVRAVIALAGTGTATRAVSNLSYQDEPFIGTYTFEVWLNQVYSHVYSFIFDEDGTGIFNPVGDPNQHFVFEYFVDGQEIQINIVRKWDHGNWYPLYPTPFPPMFATFIDDPSYMQYYSFALHHSEALELFNIHEEHGALTAYKEMSVFEKAVGQWVATDSATIWFHLTADGGGIWHNINISKWRIGTNSDNPIIIVETYGGGQNTFRIEFPNVDTLQLLDYNNGSLLSTYTRQPL
ncbi:MAG: Ig-like domain-containing protein [Firmicutes bacterium]|nr:Ig-like domain-containing protein [Bacillota bacterium]